MSQVSTFLLATEFFTDLLAKYKAHKQRKQAAKESQSMETRVERIKQELSKKECVADVWEERDSIYAVVRECNALRDILVDRDVPGNLSVYGTPFEKNSLQDLLDCKLRVYLKSDYDESAMRDLACALILLLANGRTK